MNFFCIGFFVCAIQINISTFLNYIIKLVGLLFLLVGVLEISGFNSEFKAFLKPVKILLTMSAVVSAAFLIFNLISVGNKIRNVTGIIAGTVLTLSSLHFQKTLLKLISEDKELVNDTSNVKRFVKNWNTLAVITVVNLFFDIINRIILIDIITDISGLLMAVSKIIMYIFALVILYSANKIRVDFNKKHDA